MVVAQGAGERARELGGGGCVEQRGATWKRQEHRDLNKEVGACSESTFFASSSEWILHPLTHFDQTVLEQSTVVSGTGNIGDFLYFTWLQMHSSF